MFGLAKEHCAVADRKQLLAVFTIALLSVGCSKETLVSTLDSTPVPISSPFPPDDSEGVVAAEIQLGWQGAGPFSILVDTVDPPAVVVATGLSESTYLFTGANYDETYYWQVRTTGEDGPIWRFSTRRVYSLTVVEYFESPGLTLGDIATTSTTLIATDMRITYPITTENALRIVEFPVSTSPYRSYVLPSTPLGVVVIGADAFVTTASHGLFKVRYSGAQPILISSYPYAESMRSIAVVGNRLFVSADINGTAGSIVLSIATATPILISQTTAFTGKVSVDGFRGLAASGMAGLKTLDLTDPNAPLVIGTFEMTGFRAVDADYCGDRACVVGPSILTNGIHTVDLTDPARPTLVDRFEFENGESRGVLVSGEYAFVARGLDGVAVFDVRNPDVIRLAGNFDGRADDNFYYASGDMELQGTNLYVSEGKGVAVIDVGDLPE